MREFEAEMVGLGFGDAVLKSDYQLVAVFIQRFDMLDGIVPKQICYGMGPFRDAMDLLKSVDLILRFTSTSST